MKENANREFYFLGKIALVIGIVGVVIFYVTDGTAAEWYPKCQFRSLSGLYCPGCGGTHAIMLLLRGHFLKSFYAHPFVLYAVQAYICFMSNMWISRHVKTRQIKVMNLLPFIYVGIGIIFLQWIVKLVCMVGYRVSWI